MAGFQVFTEDFKHEWPNWSPEPGSRDGWRGVLSAKIDETDEAIAYPCQETAKILLGGSSYDFEPFLSMLAEWRKKVIADCKRRAQQIIRP